MKLLLDPASRHYNKLAKCEHNKLVQWAMARVN